MTRITLLPCQKPLSLYSLFDPFKICLPHQSVTPFLNGARDNGTTAHIITMKLLLVVNRS